MRRPAPVILTAVGLAALAWTACVQVPADRRDPATFPGALERRPFPQGATAGGLVLEPLDEAPTGDPFRLPGFPVDDPPAATTAPRVP